MQVQRHTLMHRELWRRCDAAATLDYSTGTAKADSQSKAASAQPDYSRTVNVPTSGWTSTESVTVTIAGISPRGDAITEDLVIVAAGTTAVGSKPFAKITGITWTTPSGWTAGTFKLQSGAKLGLNLPLLAKAVTAVKEESTDETATPPNPTHAEPGTVDADNLTYTPTTALAVGTTIGASFTYTLYQNIDP